MKNFKEEFKNLITTQGNRKSLFKFKGTVKDLRTGLQGINVANKAVIDAINRSLDLPTLEQLLK